MKKRSEEKAKCVKEELVENQEIKKNQKDLELSEKQENKINITENIQNKIERLDDEKKENKGKVFIYFVYLSIK